MITRLYILVTLCFLLPCVSVTAAHLKGGYIEYEYVSGNAAKTTYAITVYQYLDCNSTTGQVDQDIFLGVFNAATNVYVNTITVNITGTEFKRRSSFDCVLNPPEVCYRIDRYTTTIALDNNSAGYTLAVQRCCRIAGIVNVSASSNTGVTYTITIPPAGSGLLQNASPVFEQQETALLCANNGFTLPFSATDPDGDSLKFSFDAGINTPRQDAKPNPPIQPPFPDLFYIGNYSATSPLGSKVSINATNGVISGIAPPTTGDYVVAVVVEEYRGGVKIAETRKEIHVMVAACNIPEAILPELMINCDSSGMRFENSSGSAAITSYYWDFGVEGIDTDISTNATPTYTYTDTGVYTVKLVVNREGQCPDSTTAEVRIFPGYKTSFTIAGVCNQLPYNFTDLTTANYGTVNSWKWDFGDNSSSTNTSTLQHPQHVYASPGMYTVSLETTSTKGCAGSSEIINFEVLDKPILNLSTHDTLICNGDTIMLQGYSAGNYTWTPAYNIINANTPTPLVHPSQTTTYNVLLNDQGCTNTDTVRVRVLDFISVDAGVDTSICLTDEVQLHAISEGLSFSWSPAATLDDPASKNPIATPTAATTTYTVVAALGRLCRATDNITIQAFPYPVVNAGNDTTICYATPVTLNGSTNGETFNWQPASFLDNANSLITIGHPIVSTRYMLTVRNNTGCTKPVTDDVLVKVLPRIVVNAGNDTTAVITQPLQLNAQTNGTIYSWTPGTAMNNTTITNPIVLMSAALAEVNPEYIRYVLTASTPEGCTGSDDIIIRFFKTVPSIFVPSGFTPNNDGKNDIIRPILAGVRELQYFRIFNRYGQLVYETKQVNAGWDGYIKGQPQGSGAYVYDCRAIDYTGQLLTQKGTFMLIR